MSMTDLELSLPVFRLTITDRSPLVQVSLQTKRCAEHQAVQGQELGVPERSMIWWDGGVPGATAPLALLPDRNVRVRDRPEIGSPLQKDHKLATATAIVVTKARLQ